MNEMYLREQIAKMEEMRDYLEGFCKMMQDKMADMMQQIVDLRAVGLTYEKATDYIERHYNSANGMVDTVISNITKGHITFLNEKIDILKGILNR
jgi:hypothetical protein